MEEYLNMNYRFSESQQRISEYISYDDVINAEENLIAKTKTFIKRHSVDYILCSFPTTFEKIKKLGIPCSFVYPSLETIIDTAQILIDKLKLEQMNLNLPAILYVASKEINNGSFSDINTINLQIQKCLLDFDKEYGTKFVIKPSNNGYKIFTTQNVVKKITDNFTKCNLTNYILNNTGLEVQVGYGIGTNFITARNNASIALNIAKNNNNSYIIDNSEKFYDPLFDIATNDSNNEISLIIKNVAKDAHLSISTVQRIFSAVEMLGSNNITTNDLASALHVTSANANRFLNALLNIGHVEIIDEKKSITKGRPSRVYNIKI